jgi:hypothetical protein
MAIPFFFLLLHTATVNGDVSTRAHSKLTCGGATRALGCGGLGGQRPPRGTGGARGL